MSFRNDLHADLSQDWLMKQFAKFLYTFNLNHDLYIKMIDNNGYCSGFTTLAGYAMWLELTKTYTKKDGWTSIYSVFANISKWDGKKKFYRNKKKKLFLRTKKVIKLIEYYQNIEDYGDFNQVKKHEFIKDKYNHKFVREFDLAGIFKLRDFLKPIEIDIQQSQIVETTLLEEIFKEDRMVFIRGNKHLTFAINHHHRYYYYDSNSQKGWKVFHEDFSINFVKKFFKRHFYQEADLGGFGFYVLNQKHSSHLGRYIPADVLLKATKVHLNVTADTDSHITSLIAAVIIGSLQSVHFYLKYPPVNLSAYINRETSRRYTALHMAVISNFETIIIDLLLHGAHPNKRDEVGKTPLFHAVRNFNIGIVAALLCYGANPNIADQRNITPLYVAILFNKLCLATLLLQCGAKPNKKIQEGNTVLHEAIKQGNLYTVRLLIDYQADVNRPDKKKRSPFMLALDRGQLHIAKYLIHQPGIKIGREEYIKLKSLYYFYFNNNVFQEIFVKAKTVRMIDEIKDQLKSVNNDKKYYHAALRSLRLSLKSTSHLSEREKMLHLFTTMVPILAKKRSSRFSPWKRADLSQAILKLKQCFDLEESKKQEEKKHACPMM